MSEFSPAACARPLIKFPCNFQYPPATLQTWAVYHRLSIVLDRAWLSHSDIMPSQTADSEEPYTLIFAQEVEMIDQWTELANKYLDDNSNGSLRAQIATLKLKVTSNREAALNLLDDPNHRVVKNIRLAAEKLFKTKQAADLEQTIKSADNHQKQPDPTQVKTPAFLMFDNIAALSVMVRTKAFSSASSLSVCPAVFPMPTNPLLVAPCCLSHRKWPCFSKRSPTRPRWPVSTLNVQLCSRRSPRSI